MWIHTQRCMNLISRNNSGRFDGVSVKKKSIIIHQNKCCVKTNPQIMCEDNTEWIIDQILIIKRSFTKRSHEIYRV